MCVYDPLPFLHYPRLHAFFVAPVSTHSTLVLFIAGWGVGYSPSGSGGESASSKSLRSRERRPMVESGLSHSALPLRNNHRRSGESDCGHRLFPRQTRSATLAVSLTIASPDGTIRPRKLSGSHQSGKALKTGLPHRVGDMLGISNIAHDDQKFGAGRGRDGEGAETEQPL